MQTATATPQAPCYAPHNHVPETATERLVERDLCFIGNTISIPTLSHSEGIRRIRELREAAFAAIEEMR